MKIKSITNIENFKCDNNTIIAVQSKNQPFNIQIVKLIFEKISISLDKQVSLYRISLDNIHMYLDSTGTFLECLNKLDDSWNVFTFSEFNDFYEWYKTETNTNRK